MIGREERHKRCKLFFDGCLETLGHKSMDYSNDEDAYAEVNTIAKNLNMTPEKVLSVYLYKHITSILKHCSGQDLRTETIQGRLTDAANYLALIAVLQTDVSDSSL